jgi:rod shape-determining protein MreD
MNKTFYIVFLFIFFLLLQVLVLSNVNFLGYINPYLYISFVFFFPLKENRFPLLMATFFMGVCIDFFSDSGGIHAFSILFIAYIRLFFVQLYFKKTAIDFPLFRLHLEPFGKVFNYVVTLTIIHHLILFSFTNFSLENISDILLNTLFSSVFTLILFFIGSYIFIKDQ